MSESDKQKIDKETVRIKQLLKEQQDEIKIEKQKYDQLLALFSNVKKNVADAITENLPDILEGALAGTNLGDDIKNLVIEKSGEMIDKLNEKIKGVGVDEETNVLQNIQRNKPPPTNIENNEITDELVKKKSQNPNDTNL
jgi:hypothetical protein